MLDELQSLLKGINWLFEPIEHLFKIYTNTCTIQESENHPLLEECIKHHAKSLLFTPNPVDGTGCSEPVTSISSPGPQAHTLTQMRTHRHLPPSWLACVRG